jgi:hypothetical protein
MRGGRRSSSDSTVKAVGVCGNGWLRMASVVGLWARPNGENYCGGRRGQGALDGRGNYSRIHRH